MPRDILRTTRFERELKRMKKRGKKLDKLWKVVATLAYGEILPVKHYDHALTGNYKGYRECHIEPDWLLVYECLPGDGVLTLVRTGSHADLFEKQRVFH